VLEGLGLEVRPQAGVHHAQDVPVELGRDPGSVVVGGVQPCLVLDEVEPDEEGVAGSELAGDRAQEGRDLGRVEVADRPRQEERETCAAGTEGGQVLQEVTSTGSGRIAYSVTPDTAMAGWQHTVVVTPEGNGLRQLIDSHGEKIAYEFAAAYPAYVFPLDAGKSWSLRVKAAVADDPRGRSVRVDGKVIGAERIRVPAGEFDTIKVRRWVYPGDVAFMLDETQITETDWYAPVLGRAVRTERRSSYVDYNLCGQFPACVAHGDWDIYELVEMRVARR